MRDRVNIILSGITASQKVAPAYLFIGGDSPIKLAAALNFAKALNCEGTSPPDLTCLSCQHIEKGVHPDIIMVKPETSTLKIEQIRQLKELTRYGPSQGRRQVIIIHEADALTAEAANSFLKLLEEPSDRVTFILMVNSLYNLPATIASRGQKIIFPESPVEVEDEYRTLYKQLSAPPLDFIKNTRRLLETEDPAASLQNLFCLYALDHKAKEARHILETLKGIKKRANQKLALDLLGVNLWKRN